MLNLIHQTIKVFGPPSADDWLEVLFFSWHFEVEKSVSKKVFKDVVSPAGNHFSIHEVVIILFFEFVRKSIISFIDFNKLSVSFLIFRVIFWVILHR